MRTTACPRKFGPWSICGCPLEITTVDGVLVAHCPACARFARGLCCDCPRLVDGVVGKSRRCGLHRLAEQCAQSARYRTRNRAAVNRKAKLRMRRPVERARNVAHVKAWRRAHPEKSRAYSKAQRTRQALRERRARRAA